MLVFPLSPNAGAISPEDVPKGSVFLMGCFDGVHKGHSTLLAEAEKIAGEICGGQRPTVVWILESAKKASAEQGLLTTRSEKLERFAALGADYAVIENFDDIRNFSGEEFFFGRITERFAPCAVVCGKNFRFGKGASCTSDDLKKFAESAGILCRTVALSENSGMPVSSTEIRSLIADGRIEDANRLLGYPYSVTAEILHGKALGRTIGCPTINQHLPAEKVMPKKGVYACLVSFDDSGLRTYTGVCNIGFRPTVNPNENDITVETFIIGFSGDLYGKTVKTALIGRIRDEKAFSSVDELSRQIHADTEAAEEILKRNES